MQTLPTHTIKMVATMKAIRVTKMDTTMTSTTNKDKVVLLASNIIKVKADVVVMILKKILRHSVTSP